MGEAGGPVNFEVKTWVGLLAPRGTPNRIIDRINADVAKALAEPDVRERLAGVGFEPFSSTPATMANAIAADSRKFAEIVKRAQIALD
jgi:tripartite-type tricarboxylate transporter receptor subunit TctC